MLALLIKIFAAAIGNSVTGRVEEPCQEIANIDYADPECMLNAASRLDANGEWIRALELYEAVLREWPEEHGVYARNCMAAIQQKCEQGYARE